MDGGEQGRGLLVWGRGYSTCGDKLEGAWRVWKAVTAMVSRCHQLLPGSVKRQLSSPFSKIYLEAPYMGRR